jgi:hypothetical protein
VTSGRITSCLHAIRNEQPIEVQMNRSTKIQQTKQRDRIWSVRGTASTGLISTKLPRKDKDRLQRKAERRRRSLDVSMSQETLTPLCQAAQVNLIRPIASFQCSNPPAHEAQTPPSIATMTATLCWVFSHWHRTWLSRDASPSSPERGPWLMILNSVDDKT